LLALPIGRRPLGFPQYAIQQGRLILAGGRGEICEKRNDRSDANAKQ
jgi:hypothetical protein